MFDIILAIICCILLVPVLFGLIGFIIFAAAYGIIKIFDELNGGNL